MQANSERPSYIARVHHPTLTPEEREKRMADLRRACVNIIIAQERAHRKIEQESAASGREGKAG